MKTSFIYYLGGILLLLNLSSCTKDSAGTTINSSGQIHTITITDNLSSESSIIEFYYNSDGTINYDRWKYTNSPAYSANTTYTYSSNLVTQTDYDSLNVVSAESKFYLRTNGLVDSTVFSSIPIDSVWVIQYFYNNNNLLTEAQFHGYLPGGGSGPVTNQLYTFINGNLTRIDYPSTNGYYTYEYYDTVSNLTPHAYGLPYSLNQSLNLSKKESFNETGNPSNTMTEFTHEYTFDNNNRVSTGTIHFYENGVATGEVVTYTYTYN